MSELTDRTQEQRDTRFMELALRQAATEVTRGQTPFGAVSEMISSFPWSEAQARNVLDTSR